MADGVLTSSLEQAWARYFSAHKFCRKTEGRVLTPVFGTAINLYKMTSNEEVLYMKKLGIVDVNIFVAEPSSSDSILGGLNYVEIDKILAFEVLLCQLGLQDFIKWK